MGPTGLSAARACAHADLPCVAGDRDHDLIDEPDGLGEAEEDEPPEEYYDDEAYFEEEPEEEEERPKKSKKKKSKSKRKEGYD